MAQGFFYSPVAGEPNDDFDAQQKEIERKRLMAAALLKNTQPAQGQMVSGHYVKPALGDVLAKMIGAGAGIYANEEAKKEEKSLSERKGEFTRKWLDSMPRGTPEQPAIEPDPLGNEGLGTGRPMIPRAFPSRDEMTAWQGKGLPLGADADRLGAQAVSGMALDQQRDATNQAHANSLAQTERHFKEAAINREHEKEVQRIETARLRENADIERAAQKERDSANKINENAQRAADRAAMAGAGATGTFIDAGTTLSGDVVLRNNKRPEDQVAMINGVPTPYRGPVVGKDERKSVEAATAHIKEAAYAEKLAERVLDPKNADVFDTRANIGATVSDFIGGYGKETATGLTPEQLGLRGLVGRDFAKTTKDLYGASFTQSEQERASGYTPIKGDTAELVAQKLRGAAEFAREMSAKYGTKIQQAAAARANVEGRAPSSLPPVNAKGWALKTDKNGNKAYVSPDGKQFDEVQ